MLYSTNLLLLVGLTEYNEFSPKKITIWNTSKNIPVCSSNEFKGNITTAKINKKRIVVSERNYLYIYSLEEMKILHTIYSGSINLGKIVLSPNIENNYLCYSSVQDEGIVKIYETIYPKNIKNIKAHKSPIMKITINNKGDKLATCSCKGTIIRIFNLPKGEKIFTFKRGINSAFIYCMNFNKESDKLIISYDLGNINIFNLNIDNNNEYKGIIKKIERIYITVLAYIFPDYEDSFGKKGAFLSYNNDNLNISNLISFNFQNENEIFMFTSDGFYILFNINEEKENIIKKFKTNIKDIK